MLLYHNRKSIRVILQLGGSVFPNIFLTTFLLVAYSAGLVFLLRAGHLVWLIDIGSSLRNAYAPQSFGVLSAFVVCFRTNIAWSRYWEACAQSTLMFVKWADAYSQITGFCHAALSQIPASEKKRRADIHHWKVVLAHWFSILGGFATDRLINGDISMVESRDHDAPWGERVIRREDLRSLMFSTKRKAGKLPHFVSFDLTPQSCSSQNPREWRRKWWSLKKDNSITIPILIELSSEELAHLQCSNDCGFRVFGWIIEGVTILQRSLDIPPPIFSRIYQELGSGNLGFHYAKKLADVPFPFIFTQLLAYMLFIACLLVPIFAALLSFDVDEEVSFATVPLSVLVCVPLVGLNEVSKELENPFGLDANDVPLAEGMECYVECLVDSFYSEIPNDSIPLTAEQEQIASTLKSDDTDENEMDEEHKGVRRRLTSSLFTNISSTTGLLDTMMPEARESRNNGDTFHGTHAFKDVADKPAGIPETIHGSKIKSQMSWIPEEAQDVEQDDTARLAAKMKKYEKRKRSEKALLENMAFSYRPSTRGHKKHERNSASVPAEVRFESKLDEVGGPSDDRRVNL